MDKKINEKEMRAHVKTFDKELCNIYNKPLWFIVVIYIFITLIVSALPFSGIHDTPNIICPLFTIELPYFILMPYVYATDDLNSTKNSTKVYHILRYLPVSKKQLRHVRMGYILRVIRWVAPIEIAMQCIVSIVSGVFGVRTVVYSLLVFLVLPIAAGWVQLQNADA